MWPIETQVAIAMERVVLLPVTLLLSFVLCQYFLVIYLVHRVPKRQSPRIWLLLGCAVVTFLSLIGFAYTDASTTNRLIQISDCVCLAILVLQISIVGRNSVQRVGISIATTRFMIVTDLLLFVLFSVLSYHSIALQFQCSNEQLNESIDAHMVSCAHELVKALCLLHVIGCRFYLLIKNHGVGALLRHRKLQTSLYLLLLVHQVPIGLAGSLLGPVVEWTYVSSCCMRLLLVSTIAANLYTKHTAAAMISRTVAGPVSQTAAQPLVRHPGPDQTGISTTDVNTWDRASNDDAYHDYMMMLEQMRCARVLPCRPEDDDQSVSSVSTTASRQQRPTRRARPLSHHEWRPRIQRPRRSHRSRPPRRPPTLV